MIAPGYESKDPAYFRFCRTEIVGLLPAFAERALEVGCGAGATLRYLKDAGHVGWTCGIEQDAAAAREARTHLDELRVGDVETMGLPFAPASFDLVLALDVLEHLSDPWTTARRLAALVKPGGHLIATIPNVRHFSVVAPLVLLGRWTYVPAGVSTHHTRTAPTPAHGRLTYSHTQSPSSCMELQLRSWSASCAYGLQTVCARNNNS